MEKNPNVQALALLGAPRKLTGEEWSGILHTFDVGDRELLAEKAREAASQSFGNSAQGQASEIEITAREIQKLKKELYEIIAKHSGQPYDKVWADSDRDYWMTATEAKEYGMIDELVVELPCPQLRLLKILTIGRTSITMFLHVITVQSPEIFFSLAAITSEMTWLATVETTSVCGS